MIGKLDTSGPLKGLARSRHMLLQPYFGTHQSCLWRPDLFSSRSSYILRYRHQLFKLGTDTEGESVMVKLKYYLEYLATNRCLLKTMHNSSSCKHKLKSLSENLVVYNIGKEHLLQYFQS